MFGGLIGIVRIFSDVIQDDRNPERIGFPAAGRRVQKTVFAL